MAAVLEHSLVEICGFGREAERRFREVIVSPGVSAPSGGLKFPDSAGAFHYEESGKLLSVTSNRFVHWWTSADTVQLVEESLDTNLLNNAIRLKFSCCSVLPGGVTIQETLNNVVILICTNQSVHRLVLPHPARMYRSELVTERHMQSIFTDVMKLDLQDPASCALIPGWAGHAAVPGAVAAWLSFHGDAHFALGSPAGGITVVTLPPHDSHGSASVVELKRSSVMRRISGWMPTAIRGEQSPPDRVLSLAVREEEEDSLIFALCQDHRLRMWSLTVGLDGIEKKGSDGVVVRAQSFARPTLPEALVDFTLTPTDVWALWEDESNSALVKYINFEHNTAGQWNQVFVQPPPEEEVSVGVDLDPRETYLELLFSPLRFTASAIVRALQIFRRGSERIPDASWENLKKEVTQAVESELQSSVTEFEFSQEEYRQLQVEFWSRFYSCCLQYQEVESTPLGLTVCQQTGMACLLRKGFVSFLLPCFAVDHLYLSYDQYLQSEEDTPISDDPDVARDVLQLVRTLRLVSDTVSAEMAYEMEKALEYLQTPERAAELVLENMVCNDKDGVIEDIQNKLQDIRNPSVAMMALLRELDLETDSELGLSVRMSLSQLYGSNCAVSVVCQAVCHMAMTRAQFCRDLLILQKLYLHFGDNVFLGGGAQLLQLQQDLIPRTSHLLSSYHLLKGVSQSLASSVPMDAIDVNLQHLTALELSDTPSVSTALSPQTVLELFYQTAARRIIISQIFSLQNTDSPLIWTHMISSLVQLLAQLIWPSNPGFQFPECLMANCQFTQLQDYVRLIGPWCQVNIGSCRFMLAQCYLADGEGQKALRCFQEAATEVEREEFLRKLTGSEDEEAATSPRLQYYNKVLRLLEDVGLPELVIQLASLAIAEADDDVHCQAALWTRIFKHHLDLGHNSEAYEALTQNPDSSMQLDCLRQLVVVLCERSQLQDLVQFPYTNLHDEVRNPAGASVLINEPRSDVRLLAGMLDISALILLSSDPTSAFSAAAGRRQVDILELCDLEKEYFLSRARLTLAQHHPPSAAIAGGASAQELVHLLVQTGLFDSALSLSRIFKLDLSPIFDTLTFKCIQLQSGGEEPQSEAWSWLAANQLSVVNTKESSATDEAWRLLASYLDRYPSTNGQHHRHVIHKLLSHGIPLPDWLLKSYKCVDAPSLLRLLLNFDLLETAAELVLEYVDAVLGRGHQYFGIERPLSATSPPAWLPYTAIDQLLHALSETQTHSSVSHFLFASHHVCLFVLQLESHSPNLLLIPASQQSPKQTGRVPQRCPTDDRTPTRRSETSGSMRQVTANLTIDQFSICFFYV
uniref:Nucleoporin 160 n=1 Tax=Fundulus heteroclitus TaxID=8078 RepID=A0A3Q2PVR1_FUNHE